MEIDGEIRREISIDVLRDILRIKPERIAELVRSKAQNAVRAVETGTPRVHIVDGRLLDGLLNEIFSGEGVGSLVYGNDYQQIRRATRRDVRALYSLIRGGVKRDGGESNGAATGVMAQRKPIRRSPI
jgi:amino-acid N-acetyltransferase